MTYRVPDGWDNEEDLMGNFLLLPPGADLAGVDAGTSDYVGVYSSVDPLGGCEPDEGIMFGLAPAEFAKVIRQDPDLEVSKPQPVTVGGLRGVVLDITLSASPSKACPTFDGSTVVPLIIGADTSSLEHGIIEGLTMRLYLLATDVGSMAIEVDDVHDGQHLDEYSAVIDQFRFRS